MSDDTKTTQAEPTTNVEEQRLRDDARRTCNWKRWGPYLSERQWGTVREDYSADGDCWSFLPHDHARSRAYRWGEDGLMGITDRQCRLCFAIALWNGRDAILKERLFGLTNPEGNHGEDVKECYFYLDATPTHSYLKGLYKYPQNDFPYDRLVQENRARSANDPEFELIDTGVFDEDRYFDVQVEYAKEAADDILIRITVSNRGPDAATLHLLPTLWFRNTWSWGATGEDKVAKPSIVAQDAHSFVAVHETLGSMAFCADSSNPGTSSTLTTENDTNEERLFKSPNPSRYVKDAFHRYVINGERDSVNPAGHGTKAAFCYELDVPPRSSVSLNFRLTDLKSRLPDSFGTDFDWIFKRRVNEADAFYAERLPNHLDDEERNISRQALAGLLWSKQFYHYDVAAWLRGDPNQPTPPAARRSGRNSDWTHLYNRDVISMPDKWEYPWYAAWDLAFHMIPFARIDPEFAKEQLILLLREWYMHPNGQIPAYEFAFSDVNPPVHAWACWRVYKISGKRGKRDRAFLARCFHKLLLNFTWWVNRKDPSGKHIFAGGFLGLDNIGVFDRSRPLPTGGSLEQADGTAWMAFYCATMLAMALELASMDSAYEDVASKFFEHFIAIADAMNTLGGTGLWDDGDGFYYDQMHLNGTATPLKVRSLVGLIPMLAVEILEQDVIDKLPGFSKRMRWFLQHRSDLTRHISYVERDPEHSHGEANHAHFLLAIPSRKRLERLLTYMLDESEFLSNYGIRSVSKVHERHPYVFTAQNVEYRVDYEPGESTTGLFGGNSNWRGPIWFPINYLLVEALERYGHFYGNDLKMEMPRGSGRFATLDEIALELRRRLFSLFLRNDTQRRPCHGEEERFVVDEHWRDLLLFHEFFHGESGKGLGASHQTGWTALAAEFVRKRTPLASAVANSSSIKSSDPHSLQPSR